MNIYDDTPESEPRAKRRPLGPQTVAIQKFRSSSDYQKAREEYRAQAAAQHNPDGSKGEPCWLCGQPIDYRLRWPHPRSRTLDHAVPVKDDPRLMLHSGNFRSAHRGCNERRGSDEPPLDLGEPSEAW